jgi:hypothetical protein
MLIFESIRLLAAPFVAELIAKPFDAGFGFDTY